VPTLIDDRTDEQRQTHVVLVHAVDAFLTPMGRQCGAVGKRGKSRAAWACREADAQAVIDWVSGREDMKCVQVCRGQIRPGRQDHVHVYVVNDGHPALQEEANA